MLDRRIEGRATGPAQAAHGPPQQIPVPSHQVSGQTRKLLHRSRDRTRADAARKARSAVVNGLSSAATEDLELVAEHGLLEIQLVEAAADEQAE